ncbi:cupin domain-containing protein [Prosthecobacter sp.]|uniref:cupin domain-containing protein n=1 Tax=Prosthecobacter sp. TaxID=1965333 RepID=UPI00248911F1|nr:cupin domain-containing protein [Prosthecobacter sp.]MDI1314466.1 cupin domain-containing protein [Prosthecobacter sp.]
MAKTLISPFGFSESTPNSAAHRLSSNTPVIQTGSVHQQDLQSAPINPDWIISGNPIAKVTTLAVAADQTLSCAVWECQAGKFKWVFALDEIVQILEGEVVIEEQTPGRKVHTLRAGDTAMFQDGMTTLWTVPKYVKKFAIHRTIPRSIVWRAKRKLRHLIGLVTRAGLGCYGALAHFETAVETLSMA